MNSYYNQYMPNTGYNNTGMSSAIYHVPSQEELEIIQNNLSFTNRNLSELSDKLQTTGAIINASSSCVAETIEKFRDEMKKERRKKTLQKVALLSSGICIIQFFDDNSNQCFPLLMNVTSKFTIMRLVFPVERKEKARVIIEFPDQQILICIPENCNQKVLFDAFIEAGVTFNSQLTISRCMQALAEFFLPKIRECTNEKMCTGLAGWDGKKYYAKEHLEKIRHYKHFPDSLPVLEKSLIYMGSDSVQGEADVKEYISLLNNIKGYRHRFWLFLYPYIGFLKTLLDKQGCPTDFVLTFLTNDSAVKKDIVKYLQIFNRYNIIPTYISGTEKKVMETVACAKDEVLVIENSILDCNTSYKRNLIEYNLEKIMKIAIGDRILPPPYSREATFVLAVMSDVVTTFQGCNICFVVEPNDFRDITCGCNNSDCDYIRKNFGAFVNWAVKNYDWINTRFYNCSKEFGDRESTIKVVVDIITKRFQDIGIDIWESLKINLNILFDKNLFAGDSVYENSILLKRFRKMVRENIRETFVIEKNKRIMEPSAVYFDDDWIWIPSFLCDKWLKTAGLRSQRKQLLFGLKTEGILHAEEGYTHRIQIQHKTFETIMLSRKFFNDTCEIDVIALGREKND